MRGGLAAVYALFWIGWLLWIFHSFIWRRMISPVLYRMRSPSADWKTNNSIYQFVKSLDVGVSDSILPDEPESGKLRYLYGLVDQRFQIERDEAAAFAKKLFPHLKEIAETGDRRAGKKIHDLLKTWDFDKRFGTVTDILSDMVCEGKSANLYPYFYFYARDLVLYSDHRNTVKTGLALLGLCHTKRSLEYVMTAGRHEEFTLYSVVAIKNILDASNAKKLIEGYLFKLAKSVNGWGRVAAVYNLGKYASKPRVKSWMFFDGYKCKLPAGEMADDCAFHGGLNWRLDAEIIDDRTFDAATDLVEEMLDYGNFYGNFDEAVPLYARHAAARAGSLSLRHFLVMLQLRDYIAKNGMKDAGIRKIIGLKKWKPLVMPGLRSENLAEYWYAKRAAEFFKIDYSQIAWEWLLVYPNDESRWIDVMNFATPKNIDTMLSFAESVLPLHKMAAGAPECSHGFGPEYAHDRILGSILQGLKNVKTKKFDSRVWKFLAAGIKNRMLRNRSLAVAAISEWGPRFWPKELKGMIKAAVRREPGAELKERMQAIEKKIK